MTPHYADASVTFRLRWPRLVATLWRLHLPWMWAVSYIEVVSNLPAPRLTAADVAVALPGGHVDHQAIADAAAGDAVLAAAEALRMDAVEALRMICADDDDGCECSGCLALDRLDRSP